MLRAIYPDEEQAAVLLGRPYLVRFMIAAAHKRHGVGPRAVELLADELRRKWMDGARDEHATGHCP